MQELHNLLSKHVSGGLINTSITACLSSLEELNTSFSSVFNMKEQLMGYLTQTYLSYINAINQASLIESLLESCQNQINTYLETIQLLQATAAEFGMNITMYVEKIENSSAKLNSTLSEIRSLSASLSAERNITKTDSERYEICSKMNNTKNFVSELTEHVNEMFNYFQNYTGPGSDKIWAVLANCSSAFENFTSSFDDIAGKVNIAASHVENMLKSWKNSTECSSILKNMSSRCLDGFKLFKSKPMEVNDAVRQLASNVTGYAEQIVHQSGSIGDLIINVMNLTQAIYMDKNVTNLLLTFQDINNKTAMLFNKTAEIHGMAEALNNCSITHAGANSLITNETRKFLQSLNEFEEAVNALSETKNKLAIATEEINGKQLNIQHECGNLLEYTEEFNETLSKMENNINYIMSAATKISLNLTAEIDTMVKIHHEIEVLIDEMSKTTLQLNETTYIDSIQILSENLTEYAKITLEKSQELHRRIERLCDEVGRLVGDTETRITKLQDMVEMWNTHLRSPFLPFHSCKWNLTEVTPIVTADNKEIGLAFAFILEKSAIPQFNFTEGNIILRCRLYYVPVLEYTEHTTYTVAKAELKMDFIILKWEWATEGIASQLQEYNITIPIEKEGLALWMDAASFNATKLAREEISLEQAATEMGDYTEFSVSTHINMTGGEVEDVVDITRNATDEYEKEFPLPTRMGEKLDIGFISENQTLAGFLRFVNVAEVTSPDNITTSVPVKGAYLEAGGYLMLFICYPYFDGSVLQHDPSLGLNVVETTTLEATTPEYMTKTPPPTEIAPSSQTLSEPDVTPPSINTVFQKPFQDNVWPNSEVTVYANITDKETGVRSAILSYSTDQAEWVNLTMTYNTTISLYEAKIPPQPAGTHVKYKVIAYDYAENIAVNDNAGEYYVYTVIPEIPTLSALITTTLLITTILATTKRLKKHSGKNTQPLSFYSLAG